MSKFYEIINNYPRYREISSSDILNELFSEIENWVLKAIFLIRKKQSME